MNESVLVVSAQPNPNSVTQRVLNAALPRLRNIGFDVEVFDLYGEKFDPVMGKSDHASYGQAASGQDDQYYHRIALKRAHWLVFAFPTWWYTAPAILKGYLDRVWTPGVAFSLDGGRSTGLLGHVQRLSVVTTYGAEREFIIHDIGEPGRALFERGLMRLFSPTARFDWIALYGLDTADESGRSSFVEEATRRLCDAGPSQTMP